MNQDKFFVYLIKNDVNLIDRLFCNESTILTILKDRGDILSVIRPTTNQYAFLLGDTVGWVDIRDYRKEVEFDISVI